MKLMKLKSNLFTLTLILVGLLTSLANTLADVNPATRFSGYTPTVIQNEETVQSIFKTMENRFKMIRPWKLQFGSQCTQRAETWSYELDVAQHIKLQKVFIFYTAAYHRYYRDENDKKFNWWFHVSPYVLVTTAKGTVEERVMDKTFSDTPQTMKQWTDIFIKSKQQCIENVPFANFEGDLVGGEGASYDQNAHCYIVRAPMYDMYPADIDARERGLHNKLQWDLDQVYFGAKALPSGARKSFYKRVGLE